MQILYHSTTWEAHIGAICCCSVAELVSDSLQPHGLPARQASVPHYLLEFAQVHVH